MSPNITNKARVIERDPTKFPERLYPKIKSNRDNNSSSTPNFNDSFEYEDNIYRKKEKLKQSNYSFKPEIDKKSKQIASKLQPSQERLLQKKNRSKSFDLDNSILSDVSCKSRKSDKARLDNLYNTGLNRMKSREEVYKKKKEIESEEYKKYPFKPKIIETSKTNTSTPRKEFYDKAYNWRKNVDNRINKIRTNYEKTKSKELTFKPNINKEYIPTDEKFIMKRIDQIEDYVTKRRKVLAKKKEDEEYKNKRLSAGENYTIKPTVIKPFNLHNSNARSRSKSPETINKVRKEMKTGDYFGDGKTDFNINNTVSDVSMDNNKQNEFIKAISNLQDKLSNFKI